MFRWEEGESEEFPISPRWRLRLIVAVAIITNVLTLVIILD